jgi:hypothetical protein
VAMADAPTKPDLAALVNMEAEGRVKELSDLECLAVATMVSPERAREILARVFHLSGVEYDELYRDLRALSERELSGEGTVRFEDVPYYLLAELLRRFRRELETSR